MLNLHFKRIKKIIYIYKLSILNKISHFTVNLSTGAITITPAGLATLLRNKIAIKLHITDPRQWETVQALCYSFGINWASGGSYRLYSFSVEFTYLLINKHITYAYDHERFINNDYLECKLLVT